MEAFIVSDLYKQSVNVGCRCIYGLVRVLFPSSRWLLLIEHGSYSSDNLQYRQYFYLICIKYRYSETTSTKAIYLTTWCDMNFTWIDVKMNLFTWNSSNLTFIDFSWSFVHVNIIWLYNVPHIALTFKTVLQVIVKQIQQSFMSLGHHLHVIQMYYCSKIHP